MFTEFLKFDLRYQLRQPLLWIGIAAFAFLAFGATTSDSVQIGGSIGNVHRNAPFVVVQWLNIGSSGTRVGDFARFHSGGSMQVSIFNRRYSSSRRP